MGSGSRDSGIEVKCLPQCLAPREPSIHVSAPSSPYQHVHPHHQPQPLSAPVCHHQSWETSQALPASRQPPALRAHTPPNHSYGVGDTLGADSQGPGQDPVSLVLQSSSGSWGASPSALDRQSLRALSCAITIHRLMPLA